MSGRATAAWLWIGAAALLACDAPRTERPVATSSKTDRVWALLQAKRDPALAYVEPASEARARMETWVAASVAEPWMADPPPGPFRLERVTPTGDVVAVFEAEANRGGGVYLLRRGPGSSSLGSASASQAPPRTSLVVEVPHSFADRHTLPVGLAVFRSARARALLVNSVHRFRGAGCADGDEACASDMARSTTSYFHAVHSALMQALPRTCVVAIHGFEEQAGEPDAIVSAAGTRAPVPRVLTALRGVAPHRRWALFPTEVARLGGTRGAQAQQVQAADGCMVHIELGAAFRAELMNDLALRKRLGEALASSL